MIGFRGFGGKAFLEHALEILGGDAHAIVDALQVQLAAIGLFIVLFKFGDSLKPGGLLNLALWSDDVEGTAKELKARGVEFVMEPKREPYGTMSIFKDPDGNTMLLSSR